METDHAIHIEGITCPSATDEAFNKWYDEKYVPGHLQSNSVISITRYRFVHFTDSATVKEYPQYLTNYHFANLDSLRQWKPKSWSRANGGQLIWSVRYKLLKSWGNTSPSSVVTLVGTNCRPSAETAFDKWYNERHIPDLFKFERLEGAVRYKLIGTDSAVKLTRESKFREYPVNLTFYYFKDGPTADAYFANPERINATRDDWRRTVRDTGASVPWWVLYEPIRTWRS